MNRFKGVLGVLACLFLLCSCTGGGNISGGETRSMEQPVQKVVKIKPEELHGMLSDPALLIIDLRISEHWNKCDKKILGAKRFDPNNVQSWARELDQDKKIVTYCA
ncbi:MAG: hypothetical protein U5L00_04800 [Desulfovermiculus sp.]|nr:hypothetical protein [Desulfovermiculus sp.]